LRKPSDSWHRWTSVNSNCFIFPITNRIYCKRTQKGTKCFM
jgi:hypothetical protein